MDEHIADLADIDTRRAMGFGPRKLVDIPALNIRVPRQSPTYETLKFIDFDDPLIGLSVWTEDLQYDG
jgi:hypothetical protein